MRQKFEALLESVADLEFLSPLEPVFEATRAAFLGSDELTSSPPHLRDALELKRYMFFVIIALIPAVFGAIYYYGARVLTIIAVSYAVGGTVEVAFAIFRDKEIHEGFLVTGLIFPLTLPPDVPLWVVGVGIFVATFFGKEVFGGTGRNVFNPALVGRLFITISFPEIMTTYRDPFADAVTSATPLAVFRNTGEIASLYDLAMGFEPGSIGETFRLGLIAGGVFLILVRVSNWRVPVTYLSTVALLGGLGNWLAPATIAPPLFQLLAGGLMLGAFFMATDPVSASYTFTGKYIFGFGCGFLTVLIRSFSGFTEGVMFSIVLMNAFAPLVDEMVLRVSYPRETEEI